MSAAANFRNLLEVVESRANYQSSRTAFTFLDTNGDKVDAITYAELSQQAQASAGKMLACGVQPGDNVLLAYPAGIEFIVGLFACMYAGILGAPIMLPKNYRTRFGIFEAAKKIECSHVFTAARSLQQLKSSVGIDNVLSVHAVDGSDGQTCNELAALKDLQYTNAFLQFTSGSTSGPKALVVSHNACIYNLRMIQSVTESDSNSVFVSWLPHYHDLGLVAHILHTVFCGAHCILLAPESVVIRPSVWLKSISRYRATHTGAPDFAYRLCTKRIADSELDNIDLSSLRVAINAAEPIIAETLNAFTKRFSACGYSENMFLPSYGMAEATVLISSGGVLAKPKVLNLDIAALANNIAKPTTLQGVQVVGCGKTSLQQRIAIFDPDNFAKLSDWQVGEIWVSGDNVLQHYLNDEVQTNHTFIYHADNKRYLRTGDLGFLDPDGELYITGRLKDVVIVRGANYYPHEIEHAVESCHKGIRLGGVAAFNSNDSSHRLVVVAELERLASRQVVHSSDLCEEIIALSRAAVLQHTGLEIEHLVLVKPGHVPRTTSGKVSRQKCKAMLSDGSIEVLASYIEEKQNNPKRDVAKMENKFANSLLAKVLERGPEYLNVLTTVSRVVKELLDIDVTGIDPKRSLFFYGADSVKMIELQALLEKEFNATISNHDLFDATSFEVLLDNIVIAVTSKKRDVSATILDDDVERYLTDLKPLLSANQDAPAATEDSVLITGAAGFLGVYILAELLRSSDSKAICLVRASDEVAGYKKVLARMKKYGVQAEDSWLERIEVLPGDVMDPLLGMGEEQYQILAKRVGTIIHCAAIDNFYLPYTAIRRTNVDGTVNTLKFSLVGAKKRFLHISSCAASLFNKGARDVDVYGLRNGYAQSKYVSERIVLELAAQGYSALSFRLGYLYHFGLTNLEDDDSFETLVVAMKEMGMVPDMKAVFDLVPIDHAAKCIIASEFSPSEKPLYTYYNKVPLNWQDVVSYYCDNHKEMQIVPLDEFVQAFHTFAASTGRSGVKLLESVVNEGLHEQLNTMFLDVPVDNPPAHIEDCLPCTKEFVSEYLDDVLVSRGRIKKTEVVAEEI